MNRDIDDRRFAAGTSLRRPALAGAAIALAFFGGIGGWAATAPLAGAVVAPAIVGPESHRKTVQHLEGGIVRELAVSEGSRVEAGAVLARLDRVRDGAEVSDLVGQLMAGRAAVARLTAEQQGEDRLVFDPVLEAMAGQSSGLAAALAAEAELFRTRAAALASRRGVLDRRLAKERQAIVAAQAAIGSLGEQLDLIAEEIGSVSQLLKKGLERKPRLLALQRARSDLLGRLAQNEAEVERSREAVEEARIERRNIDEEAMATVAGELATRQAQVAELTPKLEQARDRLERTVVTAPVAGTVVNLQVKTLGAVLAPGASLLDLVPANDALVLEARVAPTDIDEVAIGQEAQVYLTAFHTRRLPRVLGIVEQVSADRIRAADGKEEWYAARVRVGASALADLGPLIVLTPGMPAEALIVTAERTFLDYLLAPVTDVLRRGARES